MKNRFLCVLACALTAVTASAAVKTWYVDADWYEMGGDGSIDAPFGTIQDAIDAAKKNDIIKVKPGIYDKGSVVCTYNGNSHNIRINLNKVLTIESTGGAAATHIVGRADPATGSNGADAIRCISVTNGVSGAIVRGFTLRDSYGGATKNGFHRGGAFASYNSGKYPCFESCVISNCAANTYGGALGGTWVRCFFSGNRVTGGQSYENATTASSAYLAHCIIVANGIGAKEGAVCGCSLLNCTIVGNAGYGIGGYATSAVRNCVICQSSNADIYSGDKGPKDLLGCALGGFLVASPLLGDYRIVAGSAAELGGYYSYLDTDRPFTPPTGVSLLKDFTGADIVANTDGKVHAGAVQGAATVTGGVLVFPGPFSDKGLTARTQYACVYAQATDETVGQWQVSPPAIRITDAGATNYLNRLARTGASTICAFPDLNNVFTLTPPPLGVVCTNSFIYTKALWVDGNPDIGNDDDNDGSEGSPYETIQKAVDVGGANTVIFVAPGTYRKGVTGEVEPGSSTYGRNRLIVTKTNVRIRSTGSAADTFLVGEADETPDGLGPNAVRCFRGTDSTVALQGFTITNGHAEAWNSVLTNCQYGAAAFGLGTSGMPTIADCVIVGCHGCRDVARNVRLIRCEVRNNVADNDSLHTNSGFEWGCWVHDNTSKTGDYYGYIGSSVAAYRCTLTSGTQNGLFSRSASVYDTVAVGGDRCKVEMKQSGNVLWDFKNALSSDLPCTVADPLLCPGEPYVMSASSPAFGAGISLTNFWEQGASDFEGRPISWIGGSFDAGAVSRKSPRPWTLVRDTNGALSPSGYVLVNGSLLPQANDGSERPCIGYVADGVTNLFADAPAPITQAYATEKGCLIEPICTDAWYVDAVNGNDASNGFSPETAKLTLTNVLSCANLRSGDTVWALPGTYADGKSLHKDDLAVASRAVVPAGVTLASTDGADVTEIVGESDLETPDVCPYPTKTTDPRGCGPKSVRCVTLMKNAKLVGFTLRDGRTRILNDHYNNDCSGAGVLGATSDRKQALVERCILRDNISFRGGAGRYCTFVDCEIATNKTFYGAAVGMTCDFYGCYVHDNEDIGYPGREIMGVNVIENCTVLDDVSSLGDITVGHAVNSLFLGKAVASNDYYRCCAFADTSGVTADLLDDASIIAPADELQLADGRPVVGANLAIDKADPALDAVPPGETDLTGFQRIMNGRRDIGALEADWRGRYAKDISKSGRFTVASATADVLETNGCAVCIFPGQELRANWRGEAGRATDYTVTVEVEGDGTLTVRFGEELRTVTDTAGEPMTLTFTGAQAANALTFAYAGDDGSARILASRRMVGATLLIR